MRQLSDWNKFVMNVKAENPDKSFGEILKLASAMKKKGTDPSEYAKTSGKKNVKKSSRKSSKKVKKSTGKRKLKVNRKKGRRTRKK